MTPPQGENFADKTIWTFVSIGIDRIEGRFSCPSFHPVNPDADKVRAAATLTPLPWREGAGG